MIAEAQLRGGKAASGRAAARQVKQAIGTPAHGGPTRRSCCADSAFGTKKVIGICCAERVEFSLSVTRNKRITAAIEAINEDAYTPVHYPGAVEDPTPGADLRRRSRRNPLHLRLGRGRSITTRLIVRRVKDARYVCHERETEVLM